MIIWSRFWRQNWRWLGCLIKSEFLDSGHVLIAGESIKHSLYFLSTDKIFYVNLAFFYFNRLGGHIMMRASHWEGESLMVRVRVTFDRLRNRGWNKFSFSNQSWDLIFDLLLSFCGGANWKKAQLICSGRKKTYWLLGRRKKTYRLR